MERDKNPDCDHRIDHDTAEIVSVNDDAIEVQALCDKCGYTIYGAPSIGEMSVFDERGEGDEDGQTYVTDPDSIPAEQTDDVVFGGGVEL